MAYMTDFGKAVLFGGLVSGRLLGDTWSWSSGCWSPITAPGAPSPRYAMAAAYDPIHKKVVAYGGRTDAAKAVFSHETWLWDGTSWTLSTSSGPTLQFSWEAFDSSQQRVVLYGEGQDLLAQTWTWGGSSWQKVAGSTPSPRTGAAMGFGPNSHRVILFGGLDESTMTLLNDTWAWSGSGWSELAPAHQPTVRQGAAMASFAANHQLLLVGGIGRGVVLDDAWLWNGTDWTVTISPGPRAEASALDTGPGVLIFGGEDAVPERDDVVVWGGSTWSSQ